MIGGMKLHTTSTGPRKLGNVQIPSYYFNAFGTGISSIDNLFSSNGGFIPGQVITLAAARGSGKTTALLQILQEVTKHNIDKNCLYLSGEEFCEQLAFTAKRLNTPDVFIDNVCEISKIVELTKRYDVVVIDSMASLTCGDMKSLTQIQNTAMDELYNAAKENECVIIFILHCTKDNKAKGDSKLEHQADTCIHIHNVDSEEFGELNAKAFCIEKNRFGMTKDLIVRMTSTGWDFLNPIKEDNDKGNKNDSRSNKIKSEVEKILELQRFQMQDLKCISQDMDVLIRLSRRVNDMVKAGLIRKFGRGESAVYSVRKGK